MVLPFILAVLIEIYWSAILIVSISAWDKIGHNNSGLPLEIFRLTIMFIVPFFVAVLVLIGVQKLLDTGKSSGLLVWSSIFSMVIAMPYLIVYAMLLVRLGA